MQLIRSRSPKLKIIKRLNSVRQNFTEPDNSLS